MMVRESRSHPVAALAVAMLLATVVVSACGGGGDESAPLTPRDDGLPRPNIVLITTDDQRADTVTPRLMPNLHELLVDRGTSFSDYIVVTPLCCPSRATTLTGQYGHNNGVLANHYELLEDTESVLPAWLQRAGYRTAHVGKFLNGYEDAVEDETEVAPGWDLWFTQLHKRRYYDWEASRNGRRERYGTDDSDHATRVTTRFATRWTRRMLDDEAPFFLHLNYFAPHTGGGRDQTTCRGAPVPAPGDEEAFADEPLPGVPSFNPTDVSEKPEFIRERPRLGSEEVAQVRESWRCTLASMLSVDRGIARVHETIERAGQLDRTIFIFTSDNGYFFGEHRIPKGKRHAYEENLRMPLTIVVPPAYRDEARRLAESDLPVGNIDLAPTILELADAEPCLDEDRCRVLDGRSLLPVLSGRGFPSSRGLLVERDQCTYRGIRLDRQIYFEHGDDDQIEDGRCVPSELEHYDLDADPHQLENLYPAERGSDELKLQRKLRRRMLGLIDCVGIKGRDPEPAFGSWCE